MAENQEKVTRGIFYGFTRIILFVVAILIIALGFFTGMNSMNVNVITKDAFTMREQTVLQPKNGDNIDLTKLFTQDFIQSDPVLNSTKYNGYTVTGYYQRADVNLAIIWPWADRATVRATENVLDIVGTLDEGADQSAQTPAAKASPAPSATATAQITTKDKNPPEWASAEYDVTLVKDKNDSSWKVEEMKLIRQVEPVINAPSQTAATPPRATSTKAKTTTSANAAASATATPAKSAK